VEELVEIRLGKEAVEFIREALTFNDPLGGFLLEELDWEAGRVVTNLPPTVTADEVLQFEWGGKLKVDESQTSWITASDGRRFRIERKPDSLPALVREVREWVCSASSNSCVLSGIYVRPTFPWLQSYERPYACHQDHAYLYVPPGTTDENAIEDTLESAGVSLPGSFLTFTSTRPGLDPDQQGQAISADILHKLASHTKRLAIRAYGGEGYLFWSREE
jgi:hypothetical protein